MAGITDETYWDREIVTAELDWCADELCRRTGRPADAAGTKGNEAHRKGSHRSQEWILKSAYCTSRTYTVQAGLTSLQARHIAGLDFIPDVWGSARNRALMIEQTGRLLAAMKAGLLDDVHQLFGTLDGKTVTGWDNRANKVITADITHVDHWHAGIDRTQLTNRALMERIVSIALGDEMPMSAVDADAMKWRIEGITHGRTAVKDGPLKGEPIELNIYAKAQDAAIAALAEKVGMDPAELAAIKEAAREGALAGAEEALSPEALAAAIPDELAAEVADLLAARLVS